MGALVTSLLLVVMPLRFGHAYKAVLPWLIHEKESHSREIELHDEDPAILNLVFTYLYGLDYEDCGHEFATLSATEQANSEGSLYLSPERASSKTALCTSPTTMSLLNTKVYATADKLDIPMLKILAKEKFQNHTKHWPIPAFAKIVREVLVSTPRSDMGLRSVLGGLFLEHMEELFGVLEPDEDNLMSKTPAEYLAVLPSEDWGSILETDSQFFLDVLRGCIANKNDKWVFEGEGIAGAHTADGKEDQRGRAERQGFAGGGHQSRNGD